MTHILSLGCQPFSLCAGLIFQDDWNFEGRGKVQGFELSDGSCAVCDAVSSTGVACSTLCLSPMKESFEKT